MRELPIGKRLVIEWRYSSTKFLALLLACYLSILHYFMFYTYVEQLIHSLLLVFSNVICSYDSSKIVRRHEYKS